MRRFNVYDLLEHISDVVETREWCYRREAMDLEHEELPKDGFADAVHLLQVLERFASEAEFPKAFTVLTALNGRIESDRPPLPAVLKTDLQHVLDMFKDDIGRANFLQVPSNLCSYIDNDTILGTQVAAAFPSATSDLREAGNCLAADCNTAAVFHLMRAVEWALRALAVHLGFRQMRVVKKSGRRKIVPLSHLEWEKVLDQLQARVDKRIEGMRPGKRKQELQEFYYPALQEIRAMRDAWRNHVMHTRAEYSSGDATAIFGHVKRLMTKLATRVSETGAVRRATSSRVRRFPT